MWVVRFSFARAPAPPSARSESPIFCFQGGSRTRASGGMRAPLEKVEPCPPVLRFWTPPPQPREKTCGVSHFSVLLSCWGSNPARFLWTNPFKAFSGGWGGGATRAIADPTPRLRAPARSGSIGARIRTFASTSGAGCAKRMRLADFWKSMGIRENPPAGEILRVTLAFFGTSRNFCSFWGVAHSREAFEKQWFGSFFAWHIHERALFLPG